MWNTKQMLITEEIHQFWVRNYSPKSQDKIPEHTNKTELVPGKNKLGPLKIKMVCGPFLSGHQRFKEFTSLIKAIQVNSERGCTNSALLWGWGRFHSSRYQQKRLVKGAVQTFSTSQTADQVTARQLDVHLNHSFLLVHGFNTNITDESKYQQLKNCKRCNSAGKLRFDVSVLMWRN